MEKNKNMVRWTNEEKALLAHFVKIAINENNLNALEGCKFAAKKLGRSESACYWQWHNNIKNNNIKPLSTEEVDNLIDNNNSVINSQNEDLVETIDNLKAEIKKLENNQVKLLKFIDKCMDDLNFKVYVTLADTGCITQSDIRYNTELVSRMINHKLENLDENGNIL